MSKQMKIDFLYLDLNTCDRCMATDGTLQEALRELSGVLNTLGYTVTVNKVNITSRKLAEQYHFFSSPTILVNGHDICGSITENNCCSCGAICGDNVSCRTFTYMGETYDQPPKPMLIDGILRIIYQQPPNKKTPYTLPANLEHFFKGRDSKVNLMKEGTPVKKTMQIFEPAMCCPTGLCGVGIDPELLRISTVLDTLKKNGIIVDRFNLNSTPIEFVNNKVVNDFINDKGAEGLPVILLDGKLVLWGRYPTNLEFAKWLGLPTDLLAKPSAKVKPVKKSGGCGCKGGCC